jgi:undecaprenyl-diphosphatase
VGVNFIITGLLLWSTRGSLASAVSREPRMGGALGIGVAQAFAILPGLSRSGATVTTALWLGVDPVRAAEFSFIMAIPAIGGAALLQIPDLSADVATVGAGPLLVSFAASLVAGVAAIRILIALLRKGSFHRFAPYLWTVGVITVVWALVG